MYRQLFLYLLLYSTLHTTLISEGSRNLAPNYTGTASLVAPGASNNDFAWLEHDGFGGAQDNFLDPDAPADERLYLYLKNGETLRYGIRRIAVRYEAGVAYSSSTANPEGDNQDLTIIIYDNAGNIVQATHYDANTGSFQDATLQNTNGAGSDGIIGTVAESLLGPEFNYNSITYNSGGYTPREYTNNTGTDQDFYIAFLQDDYAFTSEAQLITDIEADNLSDIDERSWYDLWDFSVYNGNEEQPGRLHCKRWGLTAQYFDNLLADECEFYAQVPSIVAGQNAGNYIKKIDLGGLDPFSLIMYANSVGSTTASDLNGDGINDFQDTRLTTDADIGDIEYDLFINNPDIEIYPTTILPTVIITDANFYCNPSTGGGEASIFFETNQIGQIALLVDLNGISGYQAGTSDVIIETSISTDGEHVIRWDGLDGNGSTVPSGTSVTISGRFTAGPIHIPLFDVEQNAIGMNMLDVRPSTSFDLIYWDDSNEATGASPDSELDGTNTSLHTWTNGDELLVNTWSFGYYQINTQNVTFTYACDPDGDGVNADLDEDSDNDGIPDLTEGNFKADTDGDNIPDYLDADVDGDGDVDASDNWVDTNADGVNDNYDADLDGIPNALDLDSDNDGIPDIVEAGGTDSDGDGMVDGFTDVSGTTIDVFDGTYTLSSGCSTSLISTAGFTTLTFADDQTQTISIPFDFEFFGNNIGPLIYLNSNSWLSFDNIDVGGLNDYSPVSIPNGTFSNTVFFNHRDYNPSLGGSITYGISGTAPNRILAIDFSNIQIFGGGTGQTVQIQLYESNYDIRIVTTSTSTGTQTMGINNADGSEAFAVSGRNNQSYTIGGIECQSFSPDYTPVSSPNGVDDTIDGTPLPITDTDGDGIPNYLDIDADNDGIVDVWEAGGTADASNGQINGFTDVNANGWNDIQETVPLSLPDTDGDGTLNDYLDIDSDNDGILDNYEGQSSDIHVDIEAGDTNGNGLLDIYDPTNGGTFITPVDTDSNGTYDFRDSDADGDGVPDLIEGWDANINGFGDWDVTNGNNDITDETGYNVDTDSDGLWDIFDNTGTTGIANIIGSDVTRQNTDGADKADWQDQDDDNDGSLTSGEDVSGNNNWTDDFTQGQGGMANVPDYLFRGDYDGDNLFDIDDADSDNDGILDTEEANGESIDPSGDNDNDGIANYRDSDVSGSLSSATDSNGDGVFDVFDSDLDGIPDFLDSDSDNDGIWDALEAYEGSIPNGLNQTTGQFELNDPDNDGLMNYVDSSPASIGGTSTLANPDSDGDGKKDYLDIDSDNDGILDLIESQSSSSTIYPSGLDSDGDGIDDSYDPNNGGVLIQPVNTDGLDLLDYLDADSDNDNVPDTIEGNDSDRNGIADSSPTGTDTDNDGLDDAFDPDNGGVLPGLQNTDGTDQPDWRDTNDDNDSFLTKDEDNNSNGNYADDNTNGQGISLIPDYLYNGDFDLDGIPDYLDLDDDNDGILDTEEGYENVTLLNGSFESPTITTGTWELFNETVVDGWETTATDGQIEFWLDGFNGVPAFDGNQFLEINANQDAQLYQDVTTVPGTLLYWTIAHRGRSGTDEFKILIGPTSGPVDNGTFSTSNVDWVEYSGYYLVPDGQTTTRFGFESVSTSSGSPSVGNLIDNFAIFATQTGGDEDGDGLPNYLDRDSNNNGIADIIEAGGIDADGDGEVDSFTDTDNDGLHDPYDADNGGASLISGDADADGVLDVLDLDSDNDGIPDIIEAGGTDEDGNGRIDDDVDTDEDGLADVVDVDNGGTPLAVPDSDFDRVVDYKDVDSDNDGITDAVENGGSDTNSDGLIDDYASDSDGDGYADSVDPDSGGSPIANVDTDKDGIDNYIDLDADNNGYPDILEVGGTDAIADGRLDELFDQDQDGIRDAIDVDQTGGTDLDADEIDDLYDVTYTGGNDDDGDGIDNIFDKDKDGNGFSDNIESNPYDIFDIDGDGQKDFKDIDADNDGIVDVIELGLTVNSSTGTIDAFTDSDNDGLNDAQDGYLGTSPNGAAVTVVPPNSDTDPAAAVKPDFLDIDSDNDGIVDYYEAQTKATLIALTEIDVDKNGLDDVFDPNQGNTLISPVNTDATGNPDYLDDDSDGDDYIDLIEGDNANKDLYGDWDTDTDTNFDDTGYDVDTDEDGLLDIFDIENSIGVDNIIGSNAAVQDTDRDGIWDFQDIDDDNDGILTGSGGGEDSNATTDDPNNIIPDYLYGDDDADNDGIRNDVDIDNDNDGITNIAEDGGTGIDPSADNDGDGLYNFEDPDIDGDAIANGADTNTGGVNTTSFTDANNDGVIDQFDKDLDGVPDFKDRDSDNDGIADLIENGLTDVDEDGTLDEGSGITDVNYNGLDDTYDSACDGSTTSIYSTGQTNSGATDPDNAVGSNAVNFASVASGSQITLDFGLTIPSGTTISLLLNDGAAGINATANISQSDNGSTFTNTQLYSATTGVGSGTGPETFSYVLTSDAQYIRVEEESGTNRPVNVHLVSFDVSCSGGTTATILNTDSDGLANYLDLDSDNDGITDNIEAQMDGAYVSPTLTDSDGDGILDVYDEDISAGNAIDPTNTDGTDSDDYLDDDSDNDGVADIIEGWDADQDGYADWDTDSDNDPSDETGYNSDIDEDGILYLFDSNNGKGTIINITGSNATIQDTDGDNTPDYRDVDDDNDGIDTDGEDNTGNYFVFNQGGITVPDYLFNPDKDEDGISDENDLDADNDGILNADEVRLSIYAPLSDLDQDGTYNYLDTDLPGYVDVNNDGIDDRYDTDKDGIPNFFDLDSDNDGITDIIENGLPDIDQDGMVDAYTDTNSDGFDDNLGLSTSSTTGASTIITGGNSEDDPSRAVGFPDGNGLRFNNTSNDYLTLNLGGTIPTGTIIAISAEIRSNASLKTMRVRQSTSENSGYSNEEFFTLETHLNTEQYFYYKLNADAGFLDFQLTVRTSGQMRIDGIYFNSTIPPDTDNDGVPDFLDLDSDDDGITDNREGQTTAGYIAITNTDTNENGWKDVYEGAGYIDPVDTDGDLTDDYLDTDSDNDNVLDEVEGHDANKNGFSDVDLDLDGDISDQSGFENDTDNDGLMDIFDSFSGYGIANIEGSKAKFQDTDVDNIPDWRDDEDDSDGINTASEDTSDGMGGGADGIYYNDKNQGGGATPDYLFFNDTDDDGIADGIDLDSDNDGIIDDDEASGVTYNGTADTKAEDGPFDDDDGDGLFNYLDSDATGFVDADNDGIDDRVDKDSDGIPNFFDLDSDNDGIPDGVEANSGSLPISQNSNGQYPNSVADVDDDGLADVVDAGSTSTLTNPDTDGDGLPDFLDLDSDSDGISDLVEAGGNDFNDDGKLDSFGDTDGDGFGNSVDQDNGGTVLPYTDWDSDGAPNYIDIDSENDGYLDCVEGFFEEGPLENILSYIARATAYNLSNALTGNTLYAVLDLNPINGIPDYADDSDGDGIPNHLDPQSAYYIDDDNDGMVNMYDGDQNGVAYAKRSGAPDRDGDGVQNIEDLNDIPLPLDFLSFKGKVVNNSIQLTWETANEVNVSHFEVRYSTDGSEFEVIGVVDAVNQKELLNTYNFMHQRAQNGYNFYQIREVDYDNKDGFTEVINVTLKRTEISWDIYPNPTSRMVNIRSNVIIPDSRLTLVDMQGKVIFESKGDIGQNTIAVDLSDYPHGYYSLIIELPDGKQMFRIIKK